MHTTGRATQYRQIPKIPVSVSKAVGSFLGPVKERLDALAGLGGNVLDRALTLRDLEQVVAGGLKVVSQNAKYNPIQFITGDVIRTGRVESHDSKTFVDLDYDKWVMNGKLTFASDVKGLFMGRDNGEYKLNLGDATDYLKYDGSNLTWAGPLTSLAADGTLTAQNLVAMVGGRIGGWWINSDTLSSAQITGSEAEHIRLDKGNLRISIFDAAQNEKVSMGYLNGLVKNPIYGSISAFTASTLTDATQDWTVNSLAGLTVTIRDGVAADVEEVILSNTATQLTISGVWDTNPEVGDNYKVIQTDTWGVSDYGFYAVPGDNWKIDGDVTYYSGDWIVQHDGSYLIQDFAGNTIIRLGTDTGEKGLFLYNASGTNLAKYVTDEVLIGDLADTYMQYTLANGLVIDGTIAVTNFPKLPSDEGLLGYWSLNELTGTATYDSSGNSNNGAITNCSWVSGMAGGCLDFPDAGIGYVNCGTGSSLQADMVGDKSFSVWVYLDDAAFPDVSTNYVICTNEVHNVSGMLWRIEGSGGETTFRLDNDGTAPTTYNSHMTYSFSNRTWYHLVVTYDSSTGETIHYLNGEVVATETVSIDNKAATNSFYIGATSQSFQGKVDELRVYGEVLTPKEVEALYLFPSGVNSGKFEGNVSNWMHSSDVTYIDGGKIYTHSITASQIAVDTITANEIAADTLTANEIVAGTITATEIKSGTITGDEITGTTLSGIFADLGSITAGSMVLTDASGAQVKIFKTTNKGIEVLNDSGDTVFEAVTGGADVGDITIGDYAAANGAFWDDSAGTFTIKGSLDATDLTVGSINADRIASNTIITGHITADNITRSWSYDSTDSPSIALSGSTSYTSAGTTGVFTPRDAPLLVWGYFAFYVTGLASTEKFVVHTRVSRRLSISLDGVLKWTKSGSGTDEYYLTNEAGTACGIDDVTDTDVVYVDDTRYTQGAVGSLAVSYWDVDDNDSLGFDTIYIRMSDGSDPNLQDDHDIQAGFWSDTFSNKYYTGYMAWSTNLRGGEVLQTLFESPGTHPTEVVSETTYTMLSGSVTSIGMRRRNLIVMERQR